MRHDRESSLCMDRVYSLGPASCQYRLFDEECEKVPFVRLELRPGDDERNAIGYRPGFPASAPAIVVRHRDGREPEMSSAPDYLGRPRHRVGRMHRVDVKIDLQSGHLSSAWSSPSHGGDSRLQWSRERVEAINHCPVRPGPHQLFVRGFPWMPSMVRFEHVASDGSELVFREPVKGDAKALMSFINQFVDEPMSGLLIDKKVSLRDEEKWLESRLGEIRSRATVMLLAELDGRVGGSCHMSRLPWKD